MKTKGFTSTEFLVVIAIVAIVFGIAYNALYNTTPRLLNKNYGNQEMWELPSSKLQEFQEQHKGYKIITIAPQSSIKGNITHYIIVIEKIEVQAESNIKESNDGK